MRHIHIYVSLFIDWLRLLILTGMTLLKEFHSWHLASFNSIFECLFLFFYVIFLSIWVCCLIYLRLSLSITSPPLAVIHTQSDTDLRWRCSTSVCVVSLTVVSVCSEKNPCENGGQCVDVAKEEEIENVGVKHVKHGGAARRIIVHKYSVSRCICRYGFTGDRCEHGESLSLSLSLSCCLVQEVSKQTEEEEYISK